MVYAGAYARFIRFGKEAGYHTQTVVLGHEITLYLRQLLFVLFRKLEFGFAHSIDPQSFRPDLLDIALTLAFIFEDVYLGFGHIDEDREKPAITGPVKRKERDLIAAASEYALTGTILRQAVIRDLVGVL